MKINEHSLDECNVYLLFVYRTRSQVPKDY